MYFQNLIWIMVYSSERGSHPRLRRGEIMRRRHIILSEEQKQELRHTADHNDRPYMRLKSAAILKVVAGIAAKDHSLVGRQESVVYQPSRCNSTQHEWCC